MKSGWVKVRLEDLTERDSPITYGVVKPGDEGKIRFIRGGDISDGRVLVDQLRTITTEVSEQYSRTLLRGGELLICLVGQPGQVAIASENLAGANIARQVGLIRLRPDFNAKFIKYFLQSPDGKESLGIHIGGSVQQVINLGDLRTLEIPLPSSTEQNRIVAILDEAFDGIARAKANAEKNLQNARALFESHLQSVFTQRGDGWQETKEPLSSLCELIVDCEHKTAPTQEDGIPSIRTPNIGKGELLLNGVYRVSEATYKEWTRRAEPRAGDLIFAREAPAGNVGVIPSNLRVCLGQRTVLIRPKHSVFISEFLALLLLSPEIQKILLSHSRGATVQHVNMKDIRALNIGAIPSISLQAKIVEKFKAITKETQRLESLYQQKIAALDALKQSLLHQAFSGQL